jgi:hypothetical protein
MTLRRLSILAITALLITGISGVSAVLGDSSTPVNYISTNFTPITTTVSYNYDFATGALTLGTATATALAIDNIFLTVISDPTPPDPSNGATFFGTAKPEHFCDSSGCDTVVYTQSFCSPWPNACLSAGTFTFGGFVTRNARGLTLDQLTMLASQYNVQDGNCGVGSPRFTLAMSNGENIFVYFGALPSFQSCAPSTWSNPDSGVNFASDSAGLRWDSSQVCSGTQVTNYSGATACADANGLTISSIFLVTDGSWSSTAGAPSGTQTVLFRNIQINTTTRFP